MAKLREDYQFVYDTLSLRASMLIAVNSLGSEKIQPDSSNNSINTNDNISININNNIRNNDNNSGISVNDNLLLNDNQILGLSSGSGSGAVPISNLFPSVSTAFSTSDKEDTDDNLSIARNNDVSKGNDDVSNIKNKNDNNTEFPSSSPSLLTRLTTTTMSSVAMPVITAVDDEGDVMALLMLLENRRKIQVSSIEMRKL